MTEAIRENSNVVSLNFLFPSGQVVMTQGVAGIFKGNPSGPIEWFRKHLRGDWGDVCPEDAELNQEALTDGGRLMSVYSLGQDSPEPKLWIITEADRSSTTLLLPSEY